MAAPLTLFTIAEVAAILKVSRKTVAREIAAGHLRAKYVGRLPRITSRELEAYVAGPGRR